MVKVNDSVFVFKLIHVYTDGNLKAFQQPSAGNVWEAVFILGLKDIIDTVIVTRSHKESSLKSFLNVMQELTIAPQKD